MATRDDSVPTSKILSLGYLGLTAPDLDAWRRFATEICGMAVSELSTEDELRLRIDEHSWRVAVTPGDGSLAYVGWEVAGRRELLELADDLEKAGVAVEEPAVLGERGVLGLIQIKDPAGNVTEFYYGPRIAKQRFVSPTGVTFVTGEQGLGHVVLASPVADEMERFYFDVLGFRESDRIQLGPKVGLFAHVNPRHHSVAIVPSDRRFCHHFMLQTQWLDDVGLALDRCLDSGARPATTLGKHTNDHAISFYLKTPSECEIEYGWDGREISGPWNTVIYDGPSVWGHHRPY